VTLEMFDMNGRSLGIGFEPIRFDAGIHTLPFDGTGLPSGIYLACLTVGDFAQVQKLVC
jgi:hypothetical protein